MSFLTILPIILMILLITQNAFSSPTLLGFGIPSERGNFVNSQQYESLSQNLDFLGSRVSKVELHINTVMDATKGSLSSSINEFRSDIDTLVQDSVQEITATLASQKQDMDYMNRSSKMKLATFAQAVSELSNTVHLNISNKIAHLQQDISQLERMLQRSLQSEDTAASISNLDGKVAQQGEEFNRFNSSIQSTLSQLSATLDSSVLALEKKMQSNSQDYVTKCSDVVSFLEQQLLKNISSVKDALAEQSNNCTASAKATQETLDQKFTLFSANYSNLTAHFTTEIATLSGQTHAQNTALNNSISEILLRTESAHQQLRKDAEQEQKMLVEKITSVSSDFVALRSQQDTMRSLQVEQKAQHSELKSLQSSHQLEVDKLSSKVQQQGETMLVAARDISTLQQSLRDKDIQIDKLEKEIEAAKRREVDLQRETSRNISSWTERQAEKDASAGKELATLRSQVTELLAAVTAATGKITAMEKEQGQWKTRLEADSKEQKKVLEEKVEKLDKVVQSKVIALTVAEAQLQTQGQDLRALKAQREKDRDREMEKERESMLKEKRKDSADQYATKESVEKLRTLVWELQTGLLAQSGRAMEMLMKVWKKD